MKKKPKRLPRDIIVMIDNLCFYAEAYGHFLHKKLCVQESLAPDEISADQVRMQIARRALCDRILELMK